MAYNKKTQLRNSRPRGRIKSKRSLATLIPKPIRHNVLVRDKGRCIVCGSMHQLECHHLVPRSLGGMGVENNLLMLCKTHHSELHNGVGDINIIVRSYMEQTYEDITDKDRKYDKWKRGN